MGYFRIFYYISYTLNFIMRLFKRHGKQLFLLLCIFVFLVLCFYNPKSSAAYLGNDDYYDPYYAIQQKYDSICMDFIRRIENFKNSSSYNEETYNSLKARFLNSDYYLYYQASNYDDGGLSSLSGGIFNDYIIRVIFYYADNHGTSVSSSIYDTYYNINDNIREVKYTTPYYNMRFLIDTTAQTYSISNSDSNVIYYIPQSLFHYHSRYIYEYFENNVSLEELEVMYNMAQNVQTITNTITAEPSEENFSDEDFPTDSGVTNPTDTGLDTYFSSFYNLMTANPSTLDMLDKNHIDVPIPFTRKKFYYSL